MRESAQAREVEPNIHRLLFDAAPDAVLAIDERRQAMDAVERERARAELTTRELDHGITFDFTVGSTEAR